MIKTISRTLLVLAISTGACGKSNNGVPPPAIGTGGDNGSSGTGGSIGVPPSGVTATGGAPSSTGGAPGEGETPVDAAAPADGPDKSASDGAIASSDGAALPPGGSVTGWYEAEAIPPNEKAPMSTISHGAACMTMPPKPGDNCQSGGGEVNWITQGRNGWLQYNMVMAPSDGMYDVTWWYHCGNNDNFGDVHCGGQTNPPTTAAGCRPHQIVVNGTEMPGTYHFPCFAGNWITIRAATTRLPLKAGANTVKVYPKQRDSADMDALQVQAPGMGVGPLIMSNSVVGSN